MLEHGCLLKHSLHCNRPNDEFKIRRYARYAASDYDDNEDDELDFDFQLSSGTIEFRDGEDYEADEQDTNSEKNDLDFIWASTSDITSISAADHSPTTATEAPNSSMAMSPQDILLAGDGSLDDTAKKPSDSSDGEKKEEADFIEGLNKLTLEFEIILGKSEPT